MKRWLVFLLMIPAALLIAGMLGLSFFILHFFPPFVTWVAVCMMVVVGAWLLFSRRGASSIIAGSEASMIGRQSSKDGLL